MKLRWARVSVTVFAASYFGLLACTRSIPDTLPAAATPLAPAAPRPAPAVPAPATNPVSSGVCIETVIIQNRRFVPESLTVRRNCVVLFTNRDDAVEQIQGHDFLLGEMGKDQSWAHTYKEPGAFEFRSTKTPSLQGKIVVQP